MNTQDKIDSLKMQLHDLEKSQEMCKHQFDEPFPICYLEQEENYKNRPMGSVLFNPVLVEISAWKRECTLCGLVQTTTRTEPAIQCHRPVF